ncbi:hypothetical protein [Paraburkholderia sp. HP33-1]|uniref:hypothetical protein n=1 Tax=Paraburkholderia sp. HP33-1 TaxID=2883243 RepID=UPI001F1C17E6|nr:hypothetical protein [Paraburkholderia sp. HP33-1]
MAVLTIYNHGTGGASSKDASKAEIVNIFGNEARKAGREFIDWMVTEGVGAAGSPDKRLLTPQLTVDTTTGASRFDLMEYGATPGSARMDDYLKLAGTPWLARKLLPRDQALQISGVGADENVVAVLSTLKFLERANQLPDAINLMGWSRGGVTCIRIAHFLNLDPRLKAIPVNIFAIDPVAGAGHDAEPEAQTVGDNVKNYVATLSVHENRKGFTPMTLTSNAGTSLRFTGTTKYAILNMPGIHSDTAKFSSSSGRLTFHMCCQFLMAHGSNISPALRTMFKMHPNTQLAEYDKLMQGAKAAGIKTGQTGFVARFVTGRERREVYNRPTLGHEEFFINAHHHVLFKRKYPVVYRKYFTAMAAYKNTLRWQQDDNRAMGEELASMGPGHLAGIQRQHAMTSVPATSSVQSAYQLCVVHNTLAD